MSCCQQDRRFLKSLSLWDLTEDPGCPLEAPVFHPYRHRLSRDKRKAEEKYWCKQGRKVSQTRFNVCYISGVLAGLFVGAVEAYQ